MQPPHGYGPPQGHGLPQHYGPPQGYGPPGYGPPGYGYPPPKKKSHTPLIVLGVVLLLAFGGCIGLIAIASKPETPEQKAEREKKAAEAKASRDTYVATLAKIHESVESLDLDRLAPKKCDGAKMKANRKEGVSPPHVVFAPFLERFTKPDSTWAKAEGPWDWITDTSWAGFFDSPPKAGGISTSDAKTLSDYWIARRYMIVVVPRKDASSNMVPKVDKKTEDYEGGYFYGWAVVYDQTDASIACQYQLEVTSSDKVRFRDSGAFKESPEKAILADFQDNFEDALEKGMPSGVGVGTGYGKILR